MDQANPTATDRWTICLRAVSPPIEGCPWLYIVTSARRESAFVVPIKDTQVVDLLQAHGEVEDAWGDFEHFHQINADGSGWALRAALLGGGVDVTVPFSDQETTQ